MQNLANVTFPREQLLRKFKFLISLTFIFLYFWPLIRQEIRKYFSKLLWGDSIQKLLQKVFDPILQLKISYNLNVAEINRYIFFFQIQTLGGEFITIAKNPDTNKVKIFSQSGQSNIKVSNVKTKFGLVNIIDTILTWNT